MRSVAKIWFLDVFVDPALRTFQPAEILFLNPFRQRRWLIAELPFCGLGAAVFAEPAPTQVEEVSRLIHRRMSGESIRRTGTDILRPSRKICT